MLEKRQYLVCCLPRETETTRLRHELCRLPEDAVEQEEGFPEVVVVGIDIGPLVFIPHIRGQEAFQMLPLGSQ